MRRALAMFGLALMTGASAAAPGEEPPVDAATSIEQPIVARDCPAREQRIEALQQSDDRLHARLGEFLAHPAHRYCRIEKVRASNRRDATGSFSADFMLLGELARAVAVAGLALLVLWLILRVRGWTPRPDAAGRARPEAAPAGTSTPMPARPPVLPEDIPAAAEAAWRDDRARRALSLLLRGAVARLFPARQHLESRTERELLDLAAGSDLDATGGRLLRALIDAWQRTAWARQPPCDAEFRALVEGWRECLDAAGAKHR